MRKATYYYGEQQAPPDNHTDIAFIPERYIPSIIEAIEARKTSGVYRTTEAYATAYNALSRAQWEMLMDAREDLIQEIRGTRGPGPFDTTTYPVGTFPGTNMSDILGALGGPFANLDVQLTVIRGLSEEMRDLLTQIRDQGGTASEGQLDALLQIVALLSV